ncbi:MAG: ComF family protein, partial [Lachnospiraceae bacterium]|nr:ComF family protein [Lachnospiraceae bacterium]
VDKKGRQINMKKAFIVEENVVSFKRIVLIDDIFTTGSTIDSLSRVLKEAGVKEVYFLTISRAGV